MDVSELPADAPAPRLCHLVKWSDFDGYGFNLHAEKSKTGQFVGKVDERSPAQAAGLREGDRIIEVNGVNIANENHRQVVERIKANERETKLLVIEESGDLWYKERALVIRGTQANVIVLPSSARSEPRATTPSQQEDDVPVTAVVCEEETHSLASSAAESEFRKTVSTPESAATHICVNNVEEERRIEKDERNEKEEERKEEEEKEKSTPESESTAKSESVPRSESAVLLSVGQQQQQPPVQQQQVQQLQNQQPDSRSCDNNNTIKSEKSSQNVTPDRDVVDSITTIQVKSNGLNGTSSSSLPASESASGSSPPIPASPTSFKSDSSGASTNGNALSSLGSGGEGNLEVSLRMSVSQMRQMLSQKKRVDPKKVAMDLRQKYEIISSM